MNKIALLFLATFPMLKVSFAQKQKFEIKGTLSGFSDRTLIYLDDLTTSSPAHIDSSFIINNQFRFRGFKKEAVVRVMLRTANFSDYKYFWLENSAVIFKAEKGKFKEAIITGSKTQSLQNQLDAAVKTTGKEKEQSIEFIRNHSNSIISANILSVYASTWGKDTSSVLYSTLSEKIKNSSYGRNILNFITLNKHIKIGDQYIDFTEPDIAGKNVSLSDFSGKVILLEFWGSWCGPCRKGNPELLIIYNEFKDKGFDILGVAADDKKEAWVEAVRKDSLSWQNVSDLKGDKNKAALIYGVSYYPANFLIDKKGMIIAKDLKGDALRNKLDELLKP